MQLLRVATALALLTGSDALSMVASRVPVVSRGAQFARTALVMQVDEPAEPIEPVESVEAAEPVSADAAEPAPEDSVPEPVAEEPAVSPPVAEAFGMPPLEDELLDEGSIAKDALKAEVSQGLSVNSRPDAAVVGEILLALESQNPTRSPATSPLLNGKWKFLYASGASPGLKALQVLLKGANSAPKSPSGADVIDVQETFLTISADQPRAVSSTQLRFLSFENTVRLACKLEAESAVRLSETYMYSESDYMNLKLPFQSPVEYKRSLLVSYLDEELLVVRDSQGRPDILMRCDANEWSASAMGSEPASDDALNDGGAS